MRSGFFNSEIVGTDDNNMPIFDRAESAEFWAEYFGRFIGNGVYAQPANGLQVTAAGDMNLAVRAGACFINGYFAYSDLDTALTLAPSGVNPRVDRIVARLDLVARSIDLAVKQGAGDASNSTAPALVRNSETYELALADIFVGAGVSGVTQSDITDCRADTLLCGAVTGLIEQIDTADLFAQYDAAFSEWFSGLQSVMDENESANMLNMINRKLEAGGGAMTGTLPDSAAGQVRNIALSGTAPAAAIAEGALVGVYE